jgi:hypothetical protein
VAAFPIQVNDIERDILEDTVRTSGRRRRYWKSLQATLHAGVAEMQLQMLDLVIGVS